MNLTSVFASVLYTPTKRFRGEKFEADNTVAMINKIIDNAFEMANTQIVSIIVIESPNME